MNLEPRDVDRARYDGPSLPAPMDASDLDQPFEADVFAEMEAEEDWLGWGYLGARREHSGHAIDVLDEAVLDFANSADWGYDVFFDWANSKSGRWFADYALLHAQTGNTAGVDAAVRLYLGGHTPDDHNDFTRIHSTAATKGN